MQVLAVGRWRGLPSLVMHILGFMAAKPKVGGREQDVTNSSNSDFCSQLISDSTAQKAIIVGWCSW